MIERDDYLNLNKEVIQSLFAVKKHIKAVDPKLRAMIEIRVSQINGCGYCVVTHTAEARKAGETQTRLDALPVWYETRYFTKAERAAFAWTEAVTKLSEKGAPQSLYDALGDHFTAEEIANITMIIALMNAWNRLAVSFGHMPD